MITADLYDFDGTVYGGESGTDFCLFCLKRDPRLLRFLPRQLGAIIGYFIKKPGATDGLKNKLYSYLPYIDAEKEIEAFWVKNESKIYDWFRPSEHDVPTVVCSASPIFQIKPICDKLGVDLVIATQMDTKTGKLTSPNCKGEAKVEYIKKYAPEYSFRDVYTDNIVSDAPILDLAKRNRYQVEKGVVKKL